LSIKLLFADDSATMQKVVQLALEHEDFDLKIAGDGVAAFEAAHREMPDLIIADVSMPGMDGFELCKKIKNNASTMHIPFVLISGEMEEYDEKKGEEVGAVAHLTKPFKSGELMDTIRKLVENAPGAAEKPDMLELVATASDEDAEDEELEAVAIDGQIALADPDDFDLNIDDLDLQDLGSDFSLEPPKTEIEQPLESAPTTPTANDAEKILAGVFDSVEQKPEVDLEGLDSPENEDELWNKTLRELGNDEEMKKESVETPFTAVTEEAPKQPTVAVAAPAISPEQLESAFRELAESAVKEFMASKASNIFREEVSKAIGEHVKEIFETQYEKAFRDEISKMIAESFGKAMPQMLGIMEKITLQITPKIAEQMIKTAIEQIKGGEIN